MNEIIHKEIFKNWITLKGDTYGLWFIYPILMWGWRTRNHLDLISTKY